MLGEESIEERRHRAARADRADTACRRRTRGRFKAYGHGIEGCWAGVDKSWLPAAYLAPGSSIVW